MRGGDEALRAGGRARRGHGRADLGGHELQLGRGAGERRRASEPAGRSARRSGAELNEAGSPLLASEARSVFVAPGMRACAGPTSWTSRPASSGSTWRRMTESEHGHRELEPPLEPGHRLHVAELLPGRGHELLLALLDDPRAEAGGRARRRVEVELAQPRRPGVGADSRARGLMAAVDRRRDDRLVGERQELVQPVAERLVGARRRRRVSAATSGPWNSSVRPGSPTPNGWSPACSGRRPADARLAAGEPVGQRLEVAAGAGRELPVEVDRQLDLGACVASQAGASWFSAAGVTSSPSPASRPASNAGTTHAV